MVAVSIARRGVAAAAAAFAITRPASAQPAKIRLRYGTAFPADHPGTRRIAEAADAIAADTANEVELRVFPDSRLGSEAEMFNQARLGTLDFASGSGVNQSVAPLGGINAVAFAFDGYDKVWAAMDGKLGDQVRAQFAASGLHVLPRMLDNGFRHITTGTKVVNTPDDLKNLRIRVPDHQLWITLFTALGATPVSVEFAALYAALQIRSLAGEENPLPLIASARLNEVQGHAALTGHIWDGHHIFANARRWGSLPGPVQDSITCRFTEAAVKERDDIVALNATLRGTLGAAGLAFTTPDRAAFRDALKPYGFYQEWRQRFGPEAWALLEQYTGPL